MPRYFVAKSERIQSLKKSLVTSEWACNQRLNDPQPWKILHEAKLSGDVVLLFSVNNCHGFHGYATMESTISESNILEIDGKQYYRFKIQWCRIFCDHFGDKCLPFSDMDHLTFGSGEQRSLSKARNWDEIEESVAQELIRLLEKRYSALESALNKKQVDSQLANKARQFMDDCDGLSTEEIWTKLLDKVTISLGTVLLACPFGSDRYNLAIKESDTDYFIVYYCPTDSLLGFKPPAQTIKSNENEQLDYTILEVQRYCELLLCGDPKVVETLFLNPKTILKCSQYWKDLCSFRHLFLSRDLCEKYYRDATGSRGLRRLEKMAIECCHVQDVAIQSTELAKLCYIVLRLLGSARSFVFADSRSRELLVYRDESSEDHKLLTTIRNCGFSYDYIRSEIDSAIEQVNEKLRQAPNMQKAAAAEERLEQWLINLRKDNFAVKT